MSGRCGGCTHDGRGRGRAATTRNPAETFDPLDPLEPSAAPPGWPRPVGSVAVEAVGPLGRDESDEVLVSIPPVLEQAEHDELLAVLATTSTQPEKWRAPPPPRPFLSSH